MSKDLSTFFYPASVAIIGASRSPEKVGAVVLKNIIESGYKGSIYPVNPNSEQLYGLKCYKDIFSIPQTSELAVVSLPAEQAVQAVYTLGDKGTKNIIVISAGFKETGEEGVKLEQELISAINKYKLNLLGPNCLGFVNNLCPINATFGRPPLIPGNLRFVTQSGAIATSLFDWCLSVGLGFNEFVTLGNKSDINENDLIKYFLDQSKNTLFNHVQGDGPGCLPVGMYLESISNGKEFIKLTSELTKTTPVFIIKPGKTKEAAHAMQSHTGAIAGEDSIFDTALEQSGAVRCASLEDFFDLARAFAWNISPQGPNVAIISNAGGPAVISADAVVEAGLQLAQLDALTRDKLTKVLPRSASIYNPVDVLGDALADRYAQASEIILQNDNVNSLVVILTPQIMTQISTTAEQISSIAKKYNKPVCCCSFIGGGTVVEGENILNQNKIPSFRFPERAIYTIGKMWQYKKHLLSAQKAENIKNTLEPKIDEAGIKNLISQVTQKTLNNFQADELLKQRGINTPATSKIITEQEALDWVEKNQYPVVLKISAPGILHKKKLGGVITDINNPERLKNAWNIISQNIQKLDEVYKNTAQVQIQKAVLAKVELIIGVKNDKNFGPVMLFGAGGSYAELIADRNLHLLPLSIDDAKALVEKSKIYKVIADSEDKDVVLGKLYELMTRLAKLFEAVPNVSDIEINPVIISGSDVWAVDGKVIMEDTTINATAENKPATEVKPAVGPKFKKAVVTSHTNEASTFYYFELKAEEPLILIPGST